MQGRDRFWWYWPIVAALGVATFGAVLVVIPALGRQVFGLLLFSSPSGIEALGASATPYITLVHGVLGAVMVGWAITLLSVAIGPFGRGSWDGWPSPSPCPSGSSPTRRSRSGRASGRTPL